MPAGGSLTAHPFWVCGCANDSVILILQNVKTDLKLLQSVLPPKRRVWDGIRHATVRVHGGFLEAWTQNNYAAK